MKNKNDKTASQIALHQGHIDIAANIQPSENFLAFETGTNTLQGNRQQIIYFFQKMIVFTLLYIYIYNSWNLLKSLLMHTLIYISKIVGQSSDGYMTMNQFNSG